MKVGSGLGRWRGILALVAAGMFASDARLEGALLQTDGGAQVQSVSTKGPGAPAVKEGKRITAGPGLGGMQNLPVFEPVIVDYRDDAPSPIWERREGMSKALTGVVCFIDAHCGTVDTCQTYTCGGTPGKCVYTPVTGTGDPTCDDGLYCNGEETCNGANDCQPGVTSPCTVPEVCDEVADKCYPRCEEFGPNGCNDGDPNTRDSCLPDGVCLHEDIVTLGRCCKTDAPPASR